jgi:hypothetical protein
MFVFHRIIDAPPALAKFLEARSKHAASFEELKVLAQHASDEAAAARTNRPEARPRGAAKLSLVVNRDREQNKD